MIERGTLGFQVACDGKKCQEYLDVDSPDHNWNDVTRTMREEGWVSRKEQGEWIHLCPDCKEA